MEPPQTHRKREAVAVFHPIPLRWISKYPVYHDGGVPTSPFPPNEGRRLHPHLRTGGTGRGKDLLLRFPTLGCWDLDAPLHLETPRTGKAPEAYQAQLCPAAFLPSD